MFQYIRLRNYKSLVDIKVDLTKSRSIPRKLIMIYGENGIGKSNLASAFLTLHDMLETRRAVEDTERIKAAIPKTLKKKDRDSFYNHIMRFSTLESIIANTKTVMSEGTMLLEFGFRKNGHKGTYSIETDDTNVIHERLEYVYLKNQTVFFDIKPAKTDVNEKVFHDAEYRQDFTKTLEEYWGKHTLLALLVFDMRDKAKGYVKNKVDKNLIEFLDFITTISVATREGQRNERGVLCNKDRFLLDDLAQGSVPTARVKCIDQTENALNMFYTHLYSDIKQVYYARQIERNRIEYRLHFRKMIFGEVRDIDYSLESTGTLKLLDMLPYFLQGVYGGIVVIDEMDSGIHDLMVEAVLESLYPYLKGQMIITTHNTLFLESDLAKDSAYIFHVDADAHKEIVPLKNFEPHLHPNLNLRKRYLNGLYGGIPNTMEVDFSEMLPCDGKESTK